MYTNPFSSAWGANNTQEKNSSNWVVSQDSPAYGALPTFSTPPCSMTFNFTTFNSSILNCSVSGSNSLTYFYVSSNSTTTTISRRNGDVCAIIDWQRHPTIEARGILERQRTSQWLNLSSDRRRRTMTVGGKSYTWIPRGNAICLHGTDTSISGELARITQTNTTVTLQLTIPAFNAGFFEISVFATILFLSGKSVD
ncbi:hypothetical protein B0H34DRAFT_841751 [Crassisporium funariophilum]|nr:hypothetical protein B0H34DRAFT_841751 [Crassisporium funariophilum]